MSILIKDVFFFPFFSLSQACACQLSRSLMHLAAESHHTVCVFAAQVIQINFEEFDLEIAYDTLTIGDGGEVGDPTTILQV